MPGQIGATKTLFADDFSTNGKISSANWDYNHYSEPNNPSFYGRTQQRQELPSASDGVLHLQLDSFNPTDPQHVTFVGSEAITKRSFDTDSGGIAFEAKARFVQDQRGIIGGFFTFAGPANNHDEIDFEALSNDITEIQTNIYHDEPLGEGHPQSFPVSGSLTDWHTYRIEWLPNVVRWLVDGKVVRTEKVLVPDKAMAMHLNVWAPPADWPTGDASLKPAASAAQNQTWTFDIDYVKVEQLASALGGNAHDKVMGTADNDWLDGGRGSDKLVGRVGDDTLIGRAGQEVLRGGTGADTLLAGRHDDKLHGGKGGDLLRAGSGADILRGGRDTDEMKGGKGTDTFVFRAVSDSPAGSGADTIADFDPGRDTIDLRDIDANTAVDGDQAFEFIGNDPFTGNADDPQDRGELRYAVVEEGILLTADVDGDQQADLEILVAKLTALDAADFVL